MDPIFQEQSRQRQRSTVAPFAANSLRLPVVFSERSAYVVMPTPPSWRITDRYGVLVTLSAASLWEMGRPGPRTYVNHLVNLSGVALDASTGELVGFYIVDSGRGQVNDMHHYVSKGALRGHADVLGAYSIYTLEPVKVVDEDIDGIGNELDNTIVGNRGNNILAGGKGNDILIGGGGSDTYRFSLGEGQDTIIESYSGAGHISTLSFTDIDRQQLELTQVDNNLRIGVLACADSVTVQDWYLPGLSGADHKLERICISDGLSWSAAEVDALVQAMAAFAPATGVAIASTWNENPHAPTDIQLTAVVQ
jgi:hypothetical protein